MASGAWVSSLRVSTAKQGASGHAMEAQRQAVTNLLDGGRWSLTAVQLRDANLSQANIVLLPGSNRRIIARRVSRSSNDTPVRAETARSTASSISFRVGTKVAAQHGTAFQRAEPNSHGLDRCLGESKPGFVRGVKALRSTPYDADASSSRDRAAGLRSSAPPSARAFQNGRSDLHQAETDDAPVALQASVSGGDLNGPRPRSLSLRGRSHGVGSVGSQACMQDDARR